MVSAVPMACGGTDSVTIALNWAESATTKKPQTRTIGAMIQRLVPNASAVAMAHAPLAAIAIVTTRSRPMRSAASPPHTHPAAPTPMAANESNEIALRDACSWGAARMASLAASAAGIQLQNE